MRRDNESESKWKHMMHIDNILCVFGVRTTKTIVRRCYDAIRRYLFNRHIWIGSWCAWIKGHFLCANDTNVVLRANRLFTFTVWIVTSKFNIIMWNAKMIFFNSMRNMIATVLFCYVVLSFYVFSVIRLLGSCSTVCMFRLWTCIWRMAHDIHRTVRTPYTKCNRKEIVSFGFRESCATRTA